MWREEDLDIKLLPEPASPQIEGRESTLDGPVPVTEENIEKPGTHNLVSLNVMFYGCSQTATTLLVTPAQKQGADCEDYDNCANSLGKT